MHRSGALSRPTMLLLALLVLVLPTVQASAAIRPCRTDPIFALSNGDTLNVKLEINTEESNIRNLMYVIHLPEGVTVRKVTYTGGGLGTKETYKVQQDSPNDRTYTTESLVTTQNTGSIAVTATTILNKQYSGSATGTNGQYLVVTVSKP